MACRWFWRRATHLTALFELSPGINGELEDAFKNNESYRIIGFTCYHLEMMATFPSIYINRSMNVLLDDLAERLRDENQRIEAHLIRLEGDDDVTGRDLLWKVSSADAPPVDLNRSVFLRAFYEKAETGSMTTMRFPHSSQPYIICKDDPLESTPLWNPGALPVVVPRLTQINPWTGVKRDLHLFVDSNTAVPSRPPRIHPHIFNYHPPPATTRYIPPAGMFPNIPPGDDDDSDSDDDDDDRWAAAKIDVKPLEIPADCDFESSIPRCPITQEVPSDPHMLVGDGQTYDKKDIARWLQTHDTSPMSGLKLNLTQQHLVPNYAVRDIIQAKIDDFNKNIKSVASATGASSSATGASSSATQRSNKRCRN